MIHGETMYCMALVRKLPLGLGRPESSAVRRSVATSCSFSPCALYQSLTSCSLMRLTRSACVAARACAPVVPGDFIGLSLLIRSAAKSGAIARALSEANC
ncbi:hypothetical protein XAP6984_990052 [Xanthomonas phaseoli pv. phaseoli]|uniref:Uncharacterized protein n=1 Tax=Xanthomonas campestris pv. phaseoli TaxID=317013 RepID=A0ABY1TZ63_XANCH|nr:hypothetical protein XAP6984_990052 [Xanthomonas phaseoli pv. phaseoli]